MTALLVANRGEVARRVFRTARALGLRCIAVYSDADANELFVVEADEAVRIGPPAATESYLRIDRIVEAAERTGADLIHPGYGFLAEDAAFAQACEKAGLTFIGPTPEALQMMGSKDAARAIAIANGVPVLEGVTESGNEDPEHIMQAASKMGFPLIVKPAEGGGGKGMSVARDPSELAAAIASARRTGKAAFGSDRLIIERYLTGARHVEVQVFGDGTGRVIHLGERDCSMQRRHQKIIEETPCAGITDEIRAQLTASAVALASGVKYRSAGTCEFVVGDRGEISFLEMNARLQVEHPVTEMVTGLDIVQMQIQLALGQPVDFDQDAIHFNGHAMEARVYAEDPQQDFLPQAGTIEYLRWGSADRIDTGVAAGSVVGTNYDPMIAKVIVKAGDRKAASERLAAAIDGTQILGFNTNLKFLSTVIRDPVFMAGEVRTTWLEGAYASWGGQEDVPPEVIALAAASVVERAADSQIDPWAKGGWRMGAPARSEFIVMAEGSEKTVAVSGSGPWFVDDCAVMTGEYPAWTVTRKGLDSEAAVAGVGGHRDVWWQGRSYRIDIGPAQRRADAAGGAHLQAPMPGQVIAVRVTAGDKVSLGDELVVVEAMKMEHAIKAPADGVIAAVLCSPGEQVERGKVLVDFEAS